MLKIKINTSLLVFCNGSPKHLATPYHVRDITFYAIYIYFFRDVLEMEVQNVFTNQTGSLILG